VITKRLILTMTLVISRAFLERTRLKSLKRRSKKLQRRRKRLIRLKRRHQRKLLQPRVTKLLPKRPSIRGQRKRINLRLLHPRRKSWKYPKRRRKQKRLKTTPALKRRKRDKLI
jgi:hypothetical protein